LGPGYHRLLFELEIYQSSSAPLTYFLASIPKERHAFSPVPSANNSKLAFSTASSVEYFSKPPERAVVGPLHLGRKGTGRKLVSLKVIRETLTAFTLSGTGFIGAGATGCIALDITLH